MNLPASKLRIVLDPGHDDACARNHPDLGFNEQDLNLKIALACRDELMTYDGVQVFLTREDGSCPDNGIGRDDVTGRTAYAAGVDADLFVNLHNNASGLGYPSSAKGRYSDGDIKEFYYLISTSVERGFPGIIVEHAFMDNPHDNAILKQDENLKAMGIADAAGIAQYCGLKKK